MPEEIPCATPAITTGKLPIAATIVLWSARTPTVAILGFWGFLIAAHLLGTAGAPSCPLTPTDYMSLVAMVASLLGLGLALKWPRPGSAITLAAFAVGAFANWRVLMFPMTLIPITAALFLLYSFLENTSRRPDVAAVNNAGCD